MWLTSFPLPDSPAPPVGNNAEICLLPPEVGHCRAQIPSFYYDRYTQSCRQFMYGGCEGNANNFETREACEEACWRIESKLSQAHPEPGAAPRPGGLAVTRLTFQVPFSTVCGVSLNALKVKQGSLVFSFPKVITSLLHIFCLLTDMYHKRLPVQTGEDVAFRTK